MKHLAKVGAAPAVWTSLSGPAELEGGRLSSSALVRKHEPPVRLEEEGLS